MTATPTGLSTIDVHLHACYTGVPFIASKVR
jgi:hypothetical protein